MSLGTTVYNRIDQNRRNTYLLMSLFAGVITTMIWVFAQVWGVDSIGALGMAGVALIFTGLVNLFSWYHSDKIALSLSGAREIPRENNPELYNIVHGLTIGAGLPMPKIYLIDDSAPNAFATGRDPEHSAVAFTSGLLNQLERSEIEAVAAHELMHIQNRDTLYLTIVVILVGFIALVADLFTRSLLHSRGGRGGKSNGSMLLLGVLFAILTPIAAQLIRFSVSREREYLADASAALLTRHPDALANALEKISTASTPMQRASSATAHLFISNPLEKGSKERHSWFSTHPPISERIKRLRAM